jgi:hypothetical protein
METFSARGVFQDPLLEFPLLIKANFGTIDDVQECHRENETHGGHCRVFISAVLSSLLFLSFLGSFILSMGGPILTRDGTNYAVRRRDVPFGE